MLPEAHSMGLLVNVDDVFWGHHLVNGRMTLLVLNVFICRSHSAGF